MFASTAAALRADAARIRACANTLHREDDATAMRAVASRCEAAAAALEAQSRQLAVGSDG